MYMYVEKNEFTLYVLQLSQKLELDWKTVTDICLFQFKPLLKGPPFKLPVFKVPVRPSTFVFPVVLPLLRSQPPLRVRGVFLEQVVANIWSTN